MTIVNLLLLWSRILYKTIRCEVKTTFINSLICHNKITSQLSIWNSHKGKWMFSIFWASMWKVRHLFCPSWLKSIKMQVGRSILLNNFFRYMHSAEVLWILICIGLFRFRVYHFLTCNCPKTKPKKFKSLGTVLSSLILFLNGLVWVPSAFNFVPREVVL